MARAESGSLPLRPRTRYTLCIQSQQALSIVQPRQAATESSSTISRQGVVPIVLLVDGTISLNGEPVGVVVTEVALAENLELLHMSESVAVVEYIETAVPVIYAIYIATLFRLPNAKYYQDLQEFADEKLKTVVANILIYAFMELLSLLYVHRTLNCHFGFSVFYQLAFALENEWAILQCEFVTWVIVVFQFLLVHNGRYLL